MMLPVRLKVKIYKFVLYYFGRFTPPLFFTKILRMEGFKIGEGTVFYDPRTITIDRERPWMLTIGSYCKITKGVTILTHDYSRSVMRRVYGQIIGEAKETVIGDNVFIGINSIILMGCHIGNNVIVGAGSVVSGFIPDNVVVAGNPAKIIRTLDEHVAIRRAKYIEEAKEYFRLYRNRYGVWPPENDCGPFYPLFANRNTFDYDDPRLRCNGDSLDDIIRDFKNSKPIFDSYEEFVRCIGIDE